METYILKTKDFGKVIEQTYYKPLIRRSFGGHSSKEEIERCKLSRSVSRIKEIFYCNDFEYFFTLTLKDSVRYDINNAINIFVNSMNYYKKLHKQFKYVYVFELTQKGGVHLHGFVSGLTDTYINKYNHISSLYFDSIGYHSIIEAKKVNPNYLLKYILKSPVYLTQVYHCSRGLKKATVTKFHDYFDKFLDFPFTYKNKFCKMITYEKE